jgi:putative addiction module component
LLRLLDMSKAFEEIAHDATQLSREQRLHLASLLLELNEDADDPDVRAAWEREILARIRSIDEGSAGSASYEDVMRDAEERLTS